MDVLFLKSFDLTEDQVDTTGNRIHFFKRIFQVVESLILHLVQSLLKPKISAKKRLSLRSNLR